jgi:effector-binding domain-containing protein
MTGSDLIVMAPWIIFAVCLAALHTGPHSDVDRTYAALGSYAGAHGRDGTGPVRERYLIDPLDIPDSTQWRTEVCWPLAPAGPRAS